MKNYHSWIAKLISGLPEGDGIERRYTFSQYNRMKSGELLDWTAIGIHNAVQKIGMPVREYREMERKTDEMYEARK